MNLKNKDIAEGMRVTNGKNELRVVSWDKSYTDCLLNYIDSKGNRYIVAQDYKLSGTSEDPYISWNNGRYFIANSDDEALETWLDYLGEVNGYDISESLTEENKEVIRARINLDGNEDLMNLFAEEDIYDSTKYDYSYEELAKATKKLFGKVGKDFDWDFTNKNTIIVTTKKYGDFEILPLNRDLEQVSLFSFFMDGEFKEVKKSMKESKELIKDLKKVVNKAVVDAFEDSYTMDFECEGVEPNEVAEKGSGDTIHTFANIFTEMMWSSGARPKNKKAEKYVDFDIETTEENAIEEYPNDEDKQFEYMTEQWNEYAPFVRVIANPRYFKNEDGFEVCDLDLDMTLISYNTSEIVKYPTKTICFSTVSMEENINPNYVEEDDFEFEHGGYPVDEEVISEFIRQSIADYVKEF